MVANVAAQLMAEDDADRRALKFEAGIGTPSSARRIIRQLDELGLGKLLASEKTELDRAHRMSDPRVRARAQAEKDRTVLLNRLAAGEDVPAADLLAWRARSEAYQPGGAIDRLYDNAGSIVANNAAASAQAMAPKVFDSLVKATDDAVAESVKLAKKLPAHVNTDVAASAAGVLAEWIRLRELVTRFASLHGMYTELRNAGWLSQARLREPDNAAFPGTPSMFLRYGNPGKLPGAVRPANLSELWTAYRSAKLREFMALAPNLRLAEAARAGAKPGMYTAAEADAAYAKVVRRANGEHRKFRGIG